MSIPLSIEEALVSARRTGRKLPNAVSALSEVEKSQLLDQLLSANPQLRQQAETLARQRLAEQDSSTVADHLTAALGSCELEQLNSRAGYQPGIGYVEAGEAACEILDETLQPFLDDLTKRATLGMTTAATDLAVGILRGLYACRDETGAPLIEYCPDYPDERAAQILDQCARLRVELPVDDLLDTTPQWGHLLHATATRARHR
jgi:hypothetical protein